jgi:predicted phosphate transport protein (TIGR00153 family)
MKNSLFERFLPKENIFFLLLKNMATAISTAADLIIDCVEATSHQEVVNIYRQIKEQERLCDSLQTKIFEELNSSFITPFDREDINHLSGNIDNVVDNINSCAKRIMLYNPKTMPESAKILAGLVKQSAEYLTDAIAELDDLKKNPAQITEYCKQLKDIEHEADDVYEHFLIDLFENEKDGIELIKLKDILHELERATDAAETVGKIIKTIIVKYA